MTSSFRENSFTDMIGVPMKSVVNVDDEELIFTAFDDRRFIFYHRQDCCEHVRIEEIVGDLDDLTWQPIVKAEETINEDDDPSGYGTQTWTFYKFATVKGSVTVRWLGESNGYYSEAVDFRVEA